MSATLQIVGIRAVGERSILIELPGLNEVLSLQAFLLENPDEGQVEVVAAAETVLVTASSKAAATRISQRIQQVELVTDHARNDAVVVIDTVYDGVDLAEAAALAGMTPEALVAMHSQQLWTAAFTGFAPGFAYLVSDGKYPPIPRRTSPRTSVPAGSVAMAGRYSAIYPGESPGGWHLIGRTSAPMWLPERTSPALVNPGNRVQFRPVREIVAVQGVPSTAAPASPAVVVRSPGLQTTVQDLGRPGYAGVGVTGSGALDRAALRRANRLVGNGAGDAGLETVLGGLDLVAVQDQVMAVTGAPAPLTITAATGEPRRQAGNTPFALMAGERMSLGQPASGFRSYVAFRGGLNVPQVVSSRSTDMLSGTGPAPVGPDTALPVGPPSRGSVVGNPESPVPPPGDITVFRFVPGPRSDWFTQEAAASLAEQVWVISPSSNRIGLRLAGDPLERARDGELTSEGTVNGAIQIPPSGLPVFFLADHPVTGGYPVIGVVIGPDLDQAAQLGPGAKLRFQAVPDGGPVPVLPPHLHHHS